MGVIELAHSTALNGGDGRKKETKTNNNTWALTPITSHSKHWLGNAAAPTRETGLPAVGFPERLKLRRHLTCENAELQGEPRGSGAARGYRRRVL